MVPEIDIVMPWVDGADEAHQQKRQKIAQSDGAQYEPTELNASLRWYQYNEINFSLKTIAHFAPWVRKVFIVTDEQTPDLSGLPENFLEKITIVDHKMIFRGYEHVLPTFNSASISTACWRIEGLSDKYIAFNDDVFFTRPVKPEHFFHYESPILRGDYEKFNGSLDRSIAWNSHKANGARLAGVKDRKFFSLAHVCQPLRRDLLSNFFDQNLDSFEQNISVRFRDSSQYNASSLGAHLAILAGEAELRKGVRDRDWIHIAALFLQKRGTFRIREQIMNLRSDDIRIGCINDFGECLRKVPRTRAYLNDLLKGYE